MLKLLSQPSPPLVVKLALAVLMLCGFIATRAVIIMERAPTELEHTLIFSGLFVGIVATIMALSYVNLWRAGRQPARPQSRI